MTKYCIGSTHKSKYWYEYQIYINLISEFEKMGFKYQPNSLNRIYFLGWPIRKNYSEAGPIDKKANNIGISFSHAQKAENIKAFNKLYVSSTGMQNVIMKKFNIKCELLKPFSSLSPSNLEDEKYKCDLAFVGNIRVRQIVEDVIPIVEKLNLNFKIFGYDWTHYKGNKKAIKFWQGDVIPYEHLPRLAHNAKIVLVDHHASMNQMGCVSHKYVDSLMSGAFVISDFNKDAPTYKGITYQNKSQLPKLISYYLENEEERKKQQKKQYEIVQTQTTESAAKIISMNFK